MLVCIIASSLNLVDILKLPFHIVRGSDSHSGSIWLFLCSSIIVACSSTLLGFLFCYYLIKLTGLRLLPDEATLHPVYAEISSGRD